MTAPTPRMASPDRRAQLIDVAIDLFSRRGFGGTTTKEIARAAGVTEAIIFRHFATKQDLYKAILDSRCGGNQPDSWLAQIARCMDANDDEALFRALITLTIEWKQNDPRFARLLLHAALEGHELALMHHNQFALPVGQQLMEYLARRQAEGAILPLDPKAILLAIAGIADFYARQKYIHQSTDMPTSDTAIVEAFLSILLGGLRMPEKESNS